MGNLTTHLWFDTQAKEAAEFYASVFPGAKITSTTELKDTPSGDVQVVSMQVLNQKFTMSSAGPLFKFTPAISFLVNCASKEEVVELYGKLSTGGSDLMPLGEYPFSPQYAWVADKYGVSWQVMLTPDASLAGTIVPTLMFVHGNAGKAEEAMNFYTSVFPNSAVDHVMRYGAGEEPDVEGTVRHEGFTLSGQPFAAMDSAHDHKFSFSEAISIMVSCDTQEEIDFYWEKLSADPKAEQCGWLKDKYGVSWQVTPAVMEKMQTEGTEEQMARVTKAFLKMKKFDIAALEKTYGGE